jgi:3-oxoadipate enol-lactonase
MPKTFVNGFDLYYNLYGSGPPLVLVHGLGMDQTMWDLQMPTFSQDFQIVLYDLRGQGQSESPEFPYTLDLFADDLHHLLGLLGLRSANILGLSLGGTIALKFALKYARETQTLILADTRSEVHEEDKTEVLQTVELARKEGMAKAAEKLFSGPFFQELGRTHPERLRKEKARFAQTSPIGFAHSGLAIVRMERLTAFLTEVRASTLALAGEQAGPDLAFLELYARSIPRCQSIVIPKAGHWSNLENPEAFSKAVLRFLQGP